MSDFFYAKGRIVESVQFISDEIKEFETEYVNRTWQEYQSDRKIQKLMDRTLENILTALIEVSGALATQRDVKIENYSDALRKAAEILGFEQGDRERLARLAAQRNRLAHRYLNFRWQVVRVFKEGKPLIGEFLKRALELEKERLSENDPSNQPE
jgi:uncharacterized protein YutE (UPF0331/DUF86 family)